MRISLLGSLQIDGAPGSAILGAAKERSLLAALALTPGAVVANDALVGALWGDQPPSSARKTLQTYIWNLRQALGAEVIETDPAGYALRVGVDDVDVARFRALVRAGDAMLRGGDVAGARRTLREALELWRGEPFVDVAAHTGLANEGVRLAEERLSTLETRIAADLAAGAHTELVGELEALVRDHPYRERLWGDLMVALYRCGRQADALAAYQRARTILADDLGLEPGGELRRIEDAILRHDPSLAAPTAASPTSSVRAIGTTHGIVRSPVRYTRTVDDVSVAYQVAGDGPIDILSIPGFVTHLDLWWNAPTDGLVQRLTSMGRLIAFDKRGMGLSDRPEHLEPEDWFNDALAVLDAVGAEDVVVLGNSSGTPTALRLAALHPERVRALVVFCGGARTLAGPGYELGHDRALVDAFAADLEAGWGSGVAIEAFAPSLRKDPNVRAYWARYQQLAASPAAAMRSFWMSVHDDVVDLLPKIEAPTLVLHAERDLVVPLSFGRFLADHIAGAELVALDSDVHLICASDVIGDMAEEIGSFLARTLPELGVPRVEPKLTTIVAVDVPAGEQRDEVARALARLGGTVQTPAVTASFDAVGTAVGAALALRRALQRDDGVRVGVGIQTGECTPTDRGMRGEAVDTATRLAAAGAADGEVLVTGLVCQLARTADLVDASLVPRPAAGDGVLAIVEAG